ncbi:hypothetical protein [Coraliomargarita parva]|uniref:hypothetical protein n=1 Tax=Coraliomargarita parva TaxID=3014050 RepID=UPI0022B5AD05|nr:hypothetical protein [Coraliomargarita parva]
MITLGEKVLSTPRIADYDFDIIIEEFAVVESNASDSQVVVSDSLVLRNVTATVRYDARIILNPLSGEIEFQLASENEAIASVDSAGVVTTTGAGNVGIIAKTPHYAKRVTHNARTEDGITVDTFISYVDGSLAKLLSESVDDLVSSGGGLSLFNSRNDTVATYVRSNSHWTAPLDWTGVSPWNSTGGNKRGFALLSPCHGLMANHYAPAIGSKIRFVDANNSVIERTLVSKEQIGTTDILLGKLDSDVPNTIKHYKVMPGDFSDRITNQLSGGVPVVCTDQQQHVFCREALNFSAGIGHKFAELNSRPQYSESIVSGDSGQSVFLVFEGELILLGAHLHKTGFPFLSAFTDAINAAMTSLGGGYQLSIADLSAFPTY